MIIFNVELNGNDAKWFCSLSKEEKINWIKSNTNQKNDILIEEFLSSPIKEKKCGCGCNGSSNGENISKRNADEVEAVVEEINTTTNGIKPNSKKRKPTKKS